MDWFVLAYWSIGCFTLGAVMAWTRGSENNWASYTAQALLIAVLWLPILMGTALFFAGCLISAPFVRAADKRKQALRVEAAKVLIL